MSISSNCLLCSTHFRSSYVQCLLLLLLLRVVVLPAWQLLLLLLLRLEDFNVEDVVALRPGTEELGLDSDGDVVLPAGR